MFKRYCLAASFFAAAASGSFAQIVNPVPPPLRDSSYVSPDEIVSFGPNTPFNQFIQYVNPLFRQRYGKTIIDPTGRVDPIGFYVTGLPFRDALDLVLTRARLVLRESDRYYTLEPAGLVPEPGSLVVGGGGAAALPSASDREVRIDALIFELNLNRVREIGSDWGSVFGSQEGGGGGSEDTEGRLRLFLQTRTFFDAISEVISGPSQIDLAELNGIFRLFETNGLGRTISTPSIVVRSGQEGRVQSGSDIPVTLRDFAGNTVTRFISTGVIVTARPTLVVDQLESGNPIEFIHLVVDVERSAGRLSGFGVTIDKNQGATDILFVDGEQVVLGGLYSTEESVSHRGIPLLKDIPLLGYFFGVRTRSVIERELIIVLQASLVDSIPTRSTRPRARDLIDTERRSRGIRLDQSQSGLGQGVFPEND